MATIAELKLELDDVQTLHHISSAFTEAAAAKVQKIKARFEKNRLFYDEISYVYHLVRVSGNIKTQQGKTLAVAITSNQRFYGNLNFTIMQKFVSDQSVQAIDILVIGLTGKEYLEGIGFGRKYDYLNFRHDLPDAEEVKQFLDAIRKYQSVFLYYPKFETLITQSVALMDICEVAGSESLPEDEVHILFEPEYKQILEFFQEQVRALLLARVLLETDLSRTAARLMAMSTAEERSTDIIKQKTRELRKIQSSLVNMKMLETFGAISGLGKI